MGQLIVSYSRRDESFVHRLHAVLERELPDTHVWLDGDDMPSRMRSFRVEYVDAATSSDRMLLVVSTAAMRSPEVEFEWRSALECCLPVVPLLVEGTLDLVPQELRKPDLNVILFTPPSSEDGATSRLLGILRESTIPPAQLFSVPELPPHFITRLEALGNLRELMMPENRNPTVITSATRTSALVGMGGVGKSVLAAWFCRHCETRRTFSDGIMWIAFGRNASVERNIAVLARRTGAPGDPDRAIEIVRERRCLIVLDDVWRVQEVEAFRRVLGGRSRLLITSRDTGVARALGSEELPVDVLDDQRAIELLAKWVGVPPAELPERAHDLLRHCGKLPVALAMAGAMVRSRPDGWTATDQRFRSSDIEGIRQQFPEYPYPDLLRVVDVSVAALAEDVNQTPLAKVGVRARYSELAIFGEDVPFPADAAALLWQTSGVRSADAHDLLDALVKRSLIQRDSGGRLAPHDVQFDYMRATVGETSALHGRLLDAYSSRCREPGTWWTVPDDGYVRDRLALHLVQARRVDALHTLLAASMPDRRNAWHATSELEDRTDGYSADVRLAWKYGRGLRDRASRIAFDVRYALMLSSLSSASSNVPPALLATLLRTGVWTRKRGFAAARLVADSAERALSLVEVIGVSPAVERRALIQELFAALESAPDNEDRAAAAVGLIHAEGELGVATWLPSLLGLVDQSSATHALTILEALASHLSPTSAGTALEVANRVDGEEYRLRARALLVARLEPESRAAHYEQMLDEFRALDWPSRCVGVVAAIAETRPNPDRAGLLDEAEATVADMPAPVRHHALFDIALHCAGVHRARLLSEAAHPADHEAPLDAAERLAAFARRVPAHEQAVFVEGAREIDHQYSKAIGLTLLVEAVGDADRPALAAEAWSEGLVALKAMKDWDTSSAETLAGALARLGGSLDEPLRSELRDRLGRIRSPKARADAWVTFARAVRGRERIAAAGQALDALDTMHNQRETRKCLATLGPLLNKAQARRAVRIAERLREEGSRIGGLARFLPHLAPADRALMHRMSLDVIERYQDDSPGMLGDRQARDLIALSAEPDLTAALARRLFRVASTIGDVRYRIRALAEIAPRLPHALRTRAASEALALRTTLQTNDPYQRAYDALLVMPVQELAARTQSLEDILVAIQEVPHSGNQIELIASALRWVAADDSERWLNLAVRALSQDVKRSGSAVEDLLPYLTDAAVTSIRERFAYSSDLPAELVSTIARWFMIRGHGREALDLVESATRESRSVRWQCLSKISSDVPSSELAEFERLVRGADYDATRNDLLLALCRRAVEVSDVKRARKIAAELGRSPQDVDKSAVRRKLSALVVAWPAFASAERKRVSETLIADLVRLTDPVERRQFFTHVGPDLARLPADLLERVVYDTMARLANRPRTELLDTLYRLGPAIEALGGRLCVGAAAAAVRQVTEWWP